MPWYRYIHDHRQWHHRGSRSSEPRRPLGTFEVTQDYPKRRRRRWDKKPDDKPFVITDQFGDPSLVLDRSYFFDE